MTGAGPIGAVCSTTGADSGTGGVGSAGVDTAASGAEADSAGAGAL